MKQRASGASSQATNSISGPFTKVSNIRGMSRNACAGAAALLRVASQHLSYGALGRYVLAAIVHAYAVHPHAVHAERIAHHARAAARQVFHPA